MQRFFTTYEHSGFSYLKGGIGSDVLLCLHGFGEEAETFSFLEKHLGDFFTIYAIDFPWHGQTAWSKTLTFPAKGMIQLLTQIIDDFENRKIHLLCYSMGGRVGLSLLQRIPNNIQKAVLLAPDGLKVNFWYWLATQTWLGNGLFKYTMRYPFWFAWMVDVLKRFGWINMSVVKFVHAYIDDKKMRDDLYHIWTTMRKFRPNLEKVKSNIVQYQIPVHLVFGEYDRVILPANGYKFQKGAEPHISVHILKSGHQLLKEKHIDLLVKLLQHRYFN
ncbi:MAG: alpha/beta hydrolase [Chitinophagaceae bacterium]|nr:alpha/beta hydrolase [Chitinophagaceae bacterium]